MMNLKASPLAMKKHRNRSSSSILSCLPQDLLVKVVMQLASKSRTPVNDIRSLRATCKRFYGASMDKLVGRSIAFDKEGKTEWEEKDVYLALLRNCADCENLDCPFYSWSRWMSSTSRGRQIQACSTSNAQWMAAT